MLITRETIIKDLADKTQYYQKDIRYLLSNLDDLVKEYFVQVEEDKEVVMQLVEGCKLSVKVVGERERRDPRTNTAIVCKPTTKVQAKFSKVFKDFVQSKYDEKHIEKD